jgi:hypothetical protein
VLPDGTFVLGGAVSAEKLALAVPAAEPVGRGPGVLLRLAGDASEVFAIRRLDGPVSDLDVGPKGNVYVTGGFGTVKFDRLLGKELFTAAVGGADSRVAADPNGGAVVLDGKRLHFVDAAGKVVRDRKVPGSYVNDVACDPANKQVYVTGFYNRKGYKYPVQVAFVYAYDMAGKQLWTAYDWAGKEVDDRGLMADTRGYRLCVDAKGWVYLAGESAGGNTIWTRSSKDLDAKIKLAGGDQYQRAHRTAANHITFVGRLHPRTGATVAGTLLLARTPEGRGNTIRPRALAATADGKVYVGGKSADGAPISRGAFNGRFPGGGAWLCVFDAAFRRLYATKLCGGELSAVAVDPHAIVCAGVTEQYVLPVRAIQKVPGQETEGFTVVLVPSVRRARKTRPLPKGLQELEGGPAAKQPSAKAAPGPSAGWQREAVRR